jgi:cytochrome c oxidase assembly protein Cox11
VDLEIDRKIKIKFLRETKRRKEQEFEKIQNELKIVDKDIQEFSDHSEDDSEDCTVPVYNAFPDNAQERYVQKSLQLDSHFDDLQQTYFDLSSNSQPLSSCK